MGGSSLVFCWALLDTGLVCLVGLPDFAVCLGFCLLFGVFALVCCVWL